MNFFESKIFRDEMIEIRDFENTIYYNIFKFSSMTKTLEMMKPRIDKNDI